MNRLELYLRKLLDKLAGEQIQKHSRREIDRKEDRDVLWDDVIRLVPGYW